MEFRPSQSWMFDELSLLYFASRFEKSKVVETVEVDQWIMEGGVGHLTSKRYGSVKFREF